MEELTTVLIGALVTVATYLVNMVVGPIQDSALRTAVKTLVALVVAFILGSLQLLLQGNWTWGNLWANLPVVVAVAMTLYGLILKPTTKKL